MTYYNYIVVSLIIFCTITNTETAPNSLKVIRILKNLFKHSGWQNLNDVNSIIYMNNEHKLNKVIRSRIDRNNCNSRIRLATVYLGCNYAKFLKKIILILQHFHTHCEDLKGKSNRDDCILKLLNTIHIIRKETPKLRGAMDLLDSFRSLPRNHSKKTFILIPIIIYLENSKIPLPIQDNLTDTSKTLNKLNELILKIKAILDFDISKYCNITCVSDDLMLQQQYNIEIEKNTIIINNERLFYKYFSNKINDEIQVTIKEKFYDLGFQYDTETGKTTIPIHIDLISGGKFCKVLHKHGVYQKTAVSTQSVDNSIESESSEDDEKEFDNEKLTKKLKRIAKNQDTQSSTFIESPENRVYFNKYLD
ncbi:uncharacterized protein LOC126900595 isoform X1 [Daktulosphaira vitifoliae]|uniref:uncharacterized protein LOC126900595 isoform X1 n=1 Tax=Daktulosphaira vitifoliae TaxID=58002 RepID=UPI0021AA7510|nr:uncharacterized protein LOC126900595 isoform X1 [Daktulosphaira vitifoliae]XP_050532378.1 uncharacterized protein LOC126900595 isoform X1 [Daktulosphaira vitifoliae]